MQFLPDYDFELEEIQRYNQAMDPIQYKADRLKEVRKTLMKYPWAVYQLLFN